jgi:hypothetical protein
MKRRITAYDRDDEGHWRAILDCGHPQHVRHDPPLVTRTWALTEEGRASRAYYWPRHAPEASARKKASTLRLR